MILRFIVVLGFVVILRLVITLGLIVIRRLVVALVLTLRLIVVVEFGLMRGYLDNLDATLGSLGR